MGKGDKRSRKGKIFAGSYGKSRPKHKKKTAASGEAANAHGATPKKTRRKKAEE